MSKAVTVRLPDELAEWLKGQDNQTAVVVAALERLRGDGHGVRGVAEKGVPDALPPVAPSPAPQKTESVRVSTETERGTARPHRTDCQCNECWFLRKLKRTGVTG